MAKKRCPLLNRKCIESDCMFYVSLLGKNPQTGQDVNESGCAVAWLPVLLIENAQQSRQTGAAVESFRNEVVKQNDALLRLQGKQLVQQQRLKIIDDSHTPEVVGK